jgi:CrcB protein
MERLLWVCLGGGLGTGARYLIGIWARQRFGEAFPYGTLIVNIVGCFLIAVIMQLTFRTGVFSPTGRLVLTAGFLGGFTTYSSFGYETTQLALRGSLPAAFANFALTTVACFAAVLLGISAARLLPGTP